MRFSVVIPLHNGERHLPETLEAIARQTLPPEEVIVVNDASTDGGLRLAAAFGRGTVCLSTGSNAGGAGGRGVQAARNLGIAAARAPWVALCDHDDLWAPTYLESQARLLRAAPEVELSFANFRTLHDGHDRASATAKFEQAPSGWWEAAGRRILSEGWVFDGLAIAPQTFFWHPVFPSGTVVAKALLERAGVFDPALRGRRGEDGEFALRCLFRARSVGALPEPLWLYRRHETNFSRNQLLNLVDEALILTRVKDSLPEARPWRAAIEREAAKRRAEAANLAFGQGDHAMVRRLLRDIPPETRPGKLRLKAACAALPDALGLPLNALLQRLAAVLRAAPPAGAPAPAPASGGPGRDEFLRAGEVLRRADVEEVRRDRHRPQVEARRARQHLPLEGERARLRA